MVEIVGSAAPEPIADAVVIGGGVMGAATACFLARDHGASVTVLERDPRYTRASSALSASSIRQQFSTAANIALSAWSLQFLRRLPEELSVHGESPDIALVEPGYLYLAGPQGADILRRNHALQSQCGADVLWMSAAQLQARFPWLNGQDLHSACLGRSGEGWFDGPALHQAFRRKAMASGARFVQAEAVDFEVTAGGTVSAVLSRDGRRHRCGAVLLAAGAWTAPLAQRLGLTLPVSPRKRDVFVLDCPAPALKDCPLVVDPSGVWFRPEGTGYLAGAPPRSASQGGPGDPDEPPLEAIDHLLFDEVIWPALAHRVPQFEALRVRSAWAGYYEMNHFDHNGLAGPLPGWRNAYTACGFSGHGMQQAPAVGAALAAQMAQASSWAPSIEPLHPARIERGQALIELNVI